MDRKCLLLAALSAGTVLLTSGCITSLAAIFPDAPAEPSFRASLVLGPDDLYITVSEKVPREMHHPGGVVLLSRDLLGNALDGASVLAVLIGGTSLWGNPVLGTSAAIGASSLWGLDHIVSRSLFRGPNGANVARVEIRDRTSGELLGYSLTTPKSVGSDEVLHFAQIPVSNQDRDRVLDLLVLDQSGRVAHKVDVTAQVPMVAAVAPLAPETPSIQTSVEPTSDVDTPLLPVAEDPDAVALVIGIEDYGSGIPRARFAVRDAHAFRSHASSLLGVATSNMVFLRNDSATKGRIETAIKGQLRLLTVPGKSKVFVYFAGHGVPDPASRRSFLVPYDGNPDFPGLSCLPLDEVYQWLNDLRAERVTIFLDTCFSGTDARSERPTSLVSDARPLAITATRESVPEAITVFAAAQRDQVSSALTATGHGLFTYYLLKGLRGEAATQAGKVTVTSLFQYVLSQVTVGARRQGRIQTPDFQGGSSDYELFRR